MPAPARAREKAPNVIVILIDDMGFSDIAQFGDEIPTPAITALAGDGSRPTGFHRSPASASAATAATAAARSCASPPGPKAPNNHEIVVAVDEISARLIG